MARTRGSRRKRRTSRPSSPTPTPRSAPLIAAGALVGALGCGHTHDRPVPPQTVPPDNYYEPPQAPDAIDAGAVQFAPPPPEVPPEGPVPPEVPPPPQPPPPQPPVLPAPQAPPPPPPQPRPPQPRPVEDPDGLSTRTPPPLVGPFDTID